MILRNDDNGIVTKGKTFQNNDKCRNSHSRQTVAKTSKDLWPYASMAYS
jgi:hypothetical protein